MAKGLNKQLDINLAFNADTSKAKQQLLDLQKQLDGLMQSVSKKSANNLSISKMKYTIANPMNTIPTINKM